MFYASQEIPTDESVLTWWDNLKKDFKEIAVTHSKSLRHRQTAEYKALSAQYLSAEKSKQLDQMKTLKERLREMETKQWAGAQVRSTAHLLDQREQPSCYFYRKELQQGRKKTITKIIDSHGNVCNTSDSIRNAFFEFYHTLYAREEIDPVVGDMFLKDLPRLDPADAESLGRDVRLEEIETSIGQMENNKSPGPDGLPKEFYATVSSFLSPILRSVYAAIFEQGRLTDTQKMSYITLLCKDDNHAENMKNYRPISLLNVDYKILSKLLCNRLKPLLADTIHPDQTCTVPGRTILDS